MTTHSPDQVFRSRILDAYDTLPRQQRLVADWFLDHVDEAPFLGVPELAGRCGASEATVVRFAQRIGFEGFAELRTSLLESLRRRVVPPSRRTVPEALARAPEDDTLAAVARQDVGNIDHAVAHLDRSAFQAAAAAMYKADHVFTFGLGISSHLAGLLTYLLAQIGLRASRIPADSSSPLESLVALRPTDLLAVFSFPPYSRQTLELVRVAAGMGVQTVAICDKLSAPVGTLARYTLPVKSDNMMFTNSFAGISVLLNALATEIALRNREHSVEAVSRISQVLDEDPGLIP